MTIQLSENFYDSIKPRLYDRIGRAVCLAKRVLDLGCGSCELVQYLTDAYEQEVIGVDVLATGFPQERSTVKGNTYQCLKRNASRLDFAESGSFDAVIAMFSLHEMETSLAILQEAYRVLRPGGGIFIIDFPRDSLAQRLWDEDYYRPADVKTLLEESGFERVQVRLVEQEQVMFGRGYHHPALQTKNK